MQNPDICRLIFSNISRGQAGLLLRVSSALFRALVPHLYRVFGYHIYHTLVKRCNSKERLELYTGAARIVDLTCYTPPIQPANWPQVFTEFPQAFRVKRWANGDTSTLTRHLSPAGEPTYTYKLIHQVWLTSDIDVAPYPPYGIPEDWKVKRKLAITVYPRDYNGTTAAGSMAFERDLVGKVLFLGGRIERLTVTCAMPCSALLSALRELKGKGCKMPKKLDLVSCYDGFVELVNFLAPTLEWIHTNVEPKRDPSLQQVPPLPGPSYDHTDVSVEDVFTGIDWENCTRLRRVQISCRRPLSPNVLTAIKPTSPFSFGTWHYFDSFVLQLVYPPDMAEAKQQKENDMGWFPTLVERLFPLVSRFDRPWITVLFPGLSDEENSKMKQEMTEPFNHAVSAYWKAQTSLGAGA
ncbi:hypothetical protein IAT38_003616 [Cryptococcus sp. DSM 104549]